MKAYKKPKYGKSQLIAINTVEGITLEDRIERMLNNNEPIKDISEQIFTERKDGVLPEYNPRTDRWDIAIEATDKISMTQLAKRQEKMAEFNKSIGKTEDKNQGGAEHITTS